MSPIEKISCMVDHVVYYSLFNGFTVAKCRLKGIGELVTAVGTMPGVRPGDRLILTGEWVIHPVYGNQFRVNACETAPKEEQPVPAGADKRYICFDVETPNGLNDRMSAIGIAVVDRGRITETFFSYVDPEEPFAAFNTQLTGISAETVKDSPTFRDLWPTIRPLLESGVPVAHFAQFDMNVLKQCLAGYGLTWKDQVPYTCTVQIGRKIMPHISHRLNDMCRYFGIALDHHQADSDSRACAEILIRYMRAGVNPSDHLRIWTMK